MGVAGGGLAVFITAPCTHKYNSISNTLPLLVKTIILFLLVTSFATFWTLCLQIE